MSAVGKVVGSRRGEREGSVLRPPEETKENEGHEGFLGFSESQRTLRAQRTLRFFGVCKVRWVGLGYSKARDLEDCLCPLAPGLCYILVGG